jgi:phosphohistidine phosphatase SixA
MINPFNWIRDYFGIHKDRVETQKAQLEIEKLKEDRVLASRLIRTDITLEESNNTIPNSSNF